MILLQVLLKWIYARTTEALPRRHRDCTSKLRISRDNLLPTLRAVHICALHCTLRCRRAVQLRLRMSVITWGPIYKYLTIYRKVIFCLSQDRLTTVTYDVLSSFLGMSQVRLRTPSQTISRFFKRIAPEKILAVFRAMFCKLDVRHKSIVTLSLS